MNLMTIENKNRSVVSAANRTLVLHIGFGKTGTSALQQFFADNEAQLALRDIHYPKTGRREQTAHHYLATAARPGGGTGFECEQSWEEQLQDLAQEIEEINLPIVLLSSETFSGRLTWRLLNQFKDLFGKITVVMYLRRQDDLIMSSYQQWIKDSTFSVDYEDMGALPYFFDESIKQWLAFLGKHPSEIMVRPYDIVSSGEVTIFEDFMSNALGMSVPEDWILPERKKSNPRMSERVLEFKRRLNRITPPDIAGDLMAPLLDYSANDWKNDDHRKWDGSIFSPDKRKFMMEALFDSGNQQIARDFLDREDGQLFSAPSSSEEEWHGPQLVLQDARAIGRYLLHLKYSGLRANYVDKLLDQAAADADPIDGIIKVVVKKLYKRDISKLPPNEPDPVIPDRLKEQIRERLQKVDAVQPS